MLFDRVSVASQPCQWNKTSVTRSVSHRGTFVITLIESLFPQLLDTTSSDKLLTSILNDLKGSERC